MLSFQFNLFLDEIHQWVVCDGPVDAVWIENLNTVLDDNKMLCLASSERIKLTPWVHMVFEVQDLSQASPATVSRCGMVYIDPIQLGWRPLVESWMQNVPEKKLNEPLKENLFELFDKYLEKILNFAQRNCQYLIHQVDVSKVSMLLSLLTAMTAEIGGLPLMEREEAKSCLCKIFIWSTLWSVGCNFVADSKESLENHIRETVKDNPNAHIPDSSLWNYQISEQTKTWKLWESTVPPFKFDPEVAFFEMLVPTSDTVKFGRVAELLFNQNYPVLFTGDTGVGKSVLAKAILTKLAENDVIPIFINFSAQTSSARTQVK